MKRRRKNLPDPVAGGGSRNDFDHLKAINRIITEGTHLNPVTSLTELAQYRNLESIGPSDVAIAKAVMNMTARVKKDTYMDYAHFLLQPDAYPKKVRVPGMLQNPVGTEIRNFRNFHQIRVLDTTGDIVFMFSPGAYSFGKEEIRGTADARIRPPISCWKAGWVSDVNSKTDPVWTYDHMGYDFNDRGLGDYFVSGRLLAAQLTINVIMSKTASGRIVASPFYNNDSFTQENWYPNLEQWDAVAKMWKISKGTDPTKPGNDQEKIFFKETADKTVKDTNIGTVMDNKIIYDSPVEAGIQMVYIPVDQPNYDFMATNDGVYSVDENRPHKNRMDYIGIIRGLPTGSRVEVFLSGYFEFNVRDTMFELFASPYDISNYTTGSTQDLNDAINSLRGDPTNFMGAPDDRNRTAYIQDDRAKYSNNWINDDTKDYIRKLFKGALSFGGEKLKASMPKLKNYTDDDLLDALFGDYFGGRMVYYLIY
jgi:hypothetical protein